MAFSARMASRRRSTPSSEGSSLEWARYLVSGIARAAIQTKTSPGGEGTKAAAPAPFRGQTGGRAASFEGSLRSGEACADREASSACSGRPGLAHDSSLVRDRDDNFGPGRREAGEIARIGVHVVDDFRLAARGGGSADALSQWNPDVLRSLGALPRPEHELVSFDEVDADPRVVVEAVVQDGDNRAEDVVGIAPAVEDPVDRLERSGVGAHVSSASPSNAWTRSL